MHRKMRGFTEPLFELSRKKEGELLLHPGDLLVLFLLIGAGLWLLAHKWRKRDRSVTATWQWTDSSSAIRGEVPDMLREEGYDVVAAKQKLPVYVHVGSQSFESRLYVDYVAKQGSDVYLVMIARPKKPLSMTGAAIRDRFLSLFWRCILQGFYMLIRNGRIFTAFILILQGSGFPDAARGYPI